MQFDVKIRKVIENGKPLKAVASVTVDGAFVIHNVRVIETENAKFVAMPYATYQDAEGKDIKPPLRDVFKSFEGEATAISSNIKRALYKLKSMVDNEIFWEWCDTLIQCQDDRTLKDTLLPIVAKLTDVRIVNSELKTMLSSARNEYWFMVALVVGNIPLLYLLNKDWFHTLLFTTPGNRAKGKNTFIIIDEIYLLFQHEYSANFLFTLWKRVRKYGAFCTGITQNVDDLLQSHTARTMLANSEFVIMLNQASTDRIKLAELLNISDTQLSYITNVEAGRGLMKVGSALVPFVNKFPKNTKLYALMTTKFGER